MEDEIKNEVEDNMRDRDLETNDTEEYKNNNLVVEFWDYMKVRKKWWLLPIIVMLLLVAVLIVFGQSSALSPFIYALG